MKRFLVLALVLLFAGFGCAQKKVVSPEETQQPQAITQKEAKGAEDTKRITEQKVAKVVSADVSPDASKDASSKVEEVSGMFENIHFDFDKYNIREDAKPVLKSVADYLIKNNSQKILIEGHCDERGTNEYNLGLGDRRAKSTKDYLASSGISSARIKTISYGEEKPLCTEQTENCWAKNRRAHFVIMKVKK